MDPEATSKMSCSLRLFNGELKLTDPKQVPVQVNLAGTSEKKFDCSKDNSIEIPDKLSYQILTYEWQYQINGKSFSYCTDLFSQSGLASEKFTSKSAAQEYLDNLGNYDINPQKATNKTSRTQAPTSFWPLPACCSPSRSAGASSSVVCGRSVLRESDSTSKTNRGRSISTRRASMSTKVGQLWNVQARGNLVWSRCRKTQIFN